MSSTNFTIFVGKWFNHSYDGKEAATWTVAVQYGGFIIGAAALIVRTVGDRFWTILAYAIHQVSASDGLHDGLYWQHQAILRNSGSPLGAMWSLFRVPWSWTTHPRRFTWLSRVERKKKRTAMALILPLLSFASWTAAGILSARIARAAYYSNDVKIVPNDCGFYEWDPSSVVSNQVYQGYIINEAIQARNYAKDCYGVSGGLRCQTYPQSSLNHSWSLTDECPFSGERTCVANPMTMTTPWLDTHHDFGINSPPEGRIQFRKIVTCAVVDVDNYTNTSSATGAVVSEYYLGPIQNVSDFTSYTIKRAANDYVGYTVIPVYAHATVNDPWVPVPAFNRTDADVSLFFVSSGVILYVAAVDDPLFSAHTYDPEIGGYAADRSVGVVGCTDQFQLRNPSNGLESSLGGIKQFELALERFNLTDDQRAAGTRILIPSLISEMYNAVNGLGITALKAQDYVATTYSLALPDDEWQIEVLTWFRTTLALLQGRVVEYASKDMSTLGAGVRGNGTIDAIADALSRACHEQRIRSVAGYQSFSVLGISIILGVGGFIVIVSWLVDTVVGFLQGVFPRRGLSQLVRRRQWICTGVLQLQRMAFQNAGQGDWEDFEAAVPVTDTEVEIPNLLGNIPGYRGSQQRGEYTAIGTRGDDVELPHRQASLSMEQLVGRSEEGINEEGRNGEGRNEEGRDEERRHEERRHEEGRNEESAKEEGTDDEGTK